MYIIYDCKVKEVEGSCSYLLSLSNKVSPRVNLNGKVSYAPSEDIKEEIIQGQKFIINDPSSEYPNIVRKEYVIGMDKQTQKVLGIQIDAWNSATSEVETLRHQLEKSQHENHRLVNQLYKLENSTIEELIIWTSGLIKKNIYEKLRTASISITKWFKG